MSTIDRLNPCHSHPCGRYHGAPSQSSVDDVDVGPTHRGSIHPSSRGYEPNSAATLPPHSKKRLISTLRPSRSAANLFRQMMKPTLLSRLTHRRRITLTSCPRVAEGMTRERVVLSILPGENVKVVLSILPPTVGL